MVKVNGIELNISGQTITEYLLEANYNPKHIAVEKNGKIISKSLYGETIFKDGDIIEVVNFVGGG